MVFKMQVQQQLQQQQLKILRIMDFTILVNFQVRILQ